MAHWFAPSAAGPLILASLLLVIAAGWTLLWIPLHPARRARRAVMRQIFAVASTLIAALLVIALGLNLLHDWFGTWASLRGTGDVATQTTFGADPADAPEPEAVDSPTALQRDPASNPAFGSPDWSSPEQGRYLTVAIPEAGTDRSHRALVWLPPGYLTNPDTFYPVILAFAGVPGSVTSYQDLRIGEQITELNEARDMRQSIVVVPDVYENNLDTGCVDSIDGTIRVESWVTSDVTSWIATNLRPVSHPDGWATVGLSAGGWCATMLTLRHPELFSSALSMAGLYHLSFDGPHLRAENDPSHDLARIAESQAPAVRLWAWTAIDDRGPYSSLSRFATHVRAPTSLTMTTLTAGGHTNAVWRTGLPAGLSWLARTCSSFAWRPTP